MRWLAMFVMQVAAAAAGLVHPQWKSKMEVSTKCVEVPPAATSNFTNNSRWAFTSLPSGSPPEGGWPVLIQLAIIPFEADGEWPVDPNGTAKYCGYDGLNPPSSYEPWADLG